MSTRRPRAQSTSPRRLSDVGVLAGVLKTSYRPLVFFLNIFKSRLIFFLQLIFTNSASGIGLGSPAGKEVSGSFDYFYGTVCSSDWLIVRLKNFQKGKI